MKIPLFYFCLIGATTFAQTCPTTVTITTNNFATALTQSSSWIKSTSSVIGTSSVKFDANPSSGYVELNPGFIAVPTSSAGVFIAQALDGCGTAVPARAASDPSVSEIGEKSIVGNITIYPNPTAGFFNVGITDISNGIIEIADITGKTVLKQNFKDTDSTGIILEINIASLQQGVYMVKIISDKNVVSKKIIKY